MQAAIICLMFECVGISNASVLIRVASCAYCRLNKNYDDYYIKVRINIDCVLWLLMNVDIKLCFAHFKVQGTMTNFHGFLDIHRY